MNKNYDQWCNPTGEVIPKLLMFEEPFYLAKFGPVYIITRVDLVLKYFRVFMSYSAAVTVFSELTTTERRIRSMM